MTSPTIVGAICAQKCIARVSAISTIVSDCISHRKPISDRRSCTGSMAISKTSSHEGVVSPSRIPFTFWSRISTFSYTPLSKLSTNSLIGSLSGHDVSRFPNSAVRISAAINSIEIALIFFFSFGPFSPIGHFLPHCHGVPHADVSFRTAGTFLDLLLEASVFCVGTENVII